MQRPEWIENVAARPYFWTRFGLGDVFSRPDVGKENPAAFRKGHLFQRADVSGTMNKLLANFKETVVPFIASKSQFKHIPHSLN